VGEAEHHPGKTGSEGPRLSSHSGSTPSWFDVTTVASAIFGVLVALWTGYIIAIPLAAVAWVAATVVSGHRMSMRTWVLCGSILVLGAMAQLVSRGSGPRILDVSVTAVGHPSEDRFYKGLKPTSGGRMSGYLNETDGYVSLDLQMAVQSHEDDSLQDVTIELRYPSSVPVDSVGTERVDPTGAKTVYEYDLGNISPGDPYPAMREPDLIELPVKFSFDERCWLDDRQMPICSVLTWDSTMATYSQHCFAVKGLVTCVTLQKKGKSPPPKTISIGYTVRAAGRPPLDGTLRVTLEDGEPSSTYDAGGKVVRTAKTDADWDAAAVAADFVPVEGKVIDQWTRHWAHSDHVVSYRKVATIDGDIHQELSVDGVLRKVFIGRDNWVGEQITNIDGSPEADVDKVFARFWMLDWRESDFAGFT
jgi:hypothetical protein